MQKSTPVLRSQDTRPLLKSLAITSVSQHLHALEAIGQATEVGHIGGYGFVEQVISRRCREPRGRPRPDRRAGWCAPRLA